MTSFLFRDARLNAVLPGLLLSLAFVASSDTADAQEPSPQGGNAAAPITNQPITFADSIQRSFNIEPVVQRFRGRRGEIIPFSFTITSTGKPLNLSVMLVSLRQEESGVIIHDVRTPPPQHVRFTTETNFSLAPGQSRTLEGEVTVPITKTNYLSYGLLVRDQGDINELTNQANPNDTSTRASVKFVTQYLLRVDLETRGTELGELNQLKLLEGTVKSVNGMPVAELFLENPTDLAVECTARGQISSTQLSRSKPFSMGLESRASLSGDDRYLVRLMPRSRVRLYAPVEDGILPGRHNLAVSLSFDQRKLSESAFDFDVYPGQFPALETQVAHLANLLSVEPAQIELGLTRGARRTVTLKLMNNSSVEQTIVLEPRDLSGNTFEKVKLSSDSITLAPGRYRNIRVSLGDGENQALYGSIAVLTRSGQSIESAGNLPMALLFGEPPLPQVETSPLQAVNGERGVEFRVTVTNRGIGFVPVDAEMRIAAQRGGSIAMSDGFGRWLAPGQTRELKFAPEKPLPDGDYQLALFIRTTPEVPPQTTTLEITLPLKSSATEVIKAANLVTQ